MKLYLWPNASTAVAGRLRVSLQLGRINKAAMVCMNVKSGTMVRITELEGRVHSSFVETRVVSRARLFGSGSGLNLTKISGLFRA